MTSSHPYFPRYLLVMCAAALFAGCASRPDSRLPRGHIQQVGFVWLKHPGNAEERRRIIEAAHCFVREIPDVESMSVGQPVIEPASQFSDQSFDVSFVLRFRDEAARQRYNAHPVHQKAAREVFLPLSRKLLFYRFTIE